MSARWWTLGVWALVAGSALAWGLRILVKPAAAPAHTQTATTAVTPHGDLTRLLGADAPLTAAETAPAPVPDARFQLVGVVSPRSPKAAHEGLALIAVDGQPPKAFRVGAVVDGSTVLQSVAARGATLGPRDGAAVVALNLAPPVPPATGVMAPVGNAGAPALRALRPPPSRLPSRLPVRPTVSPPVGLDQPEAEAEPTMQGLPTR